MFAKVKDLQANGNKKPIVINAIIKPDDPVATAYMPLDEKLYGKDAVAEFADKYHIDTKQQPALGELLRAEGDEL